MSFLFRNAISTEKSIFLCLAILNRLSSGASLTTTNCLSSSRPPFPFQIFQQLLWTPKASWLYKLCEHDHLWQLHLFILWSLHELCLRVVKVIPTWFQREICLYNCLGWIRFNLGLSLCPQGPFSMNPQLKLSLFFLWAKFHFLDLLFWGELHSI